MEKILKALKRDLPSVNFTAGNTFRWSPADTTVTYKDTNDAKAHLSLLHEASHALLGHQNYSDDLDLLMMEVEAWERARRLAAEFGITADQEYIQDRLDTYRDWLHQRSTCPRCSTVSLQVSSTDYQCHNCSAMWQVSTSRFCRPYRQIKIPG